MTASLTLLYITCKVPSTHFKNSAEPTDTPDGSGFQGIYLP
jgi:hypothetical protein